ncbi:MAG: carboxypeptidase regulatory-like domain-containing protein [Candidatus Brocadia sp.]|nr:carboxypeptidase regulatory-like domain-containing protein [Candidatus Brocadia sp.]
MPPGTFWGKVTNKNTGAGISGAQMAFDGPTDATVNRNTDGSYVSPLLNSGTYTIRVTASGYQTITNSGVNLPEGGYVQKNYRMTPTPA